jgi:hypothetical protein
MKRYRPNPATNILAPTTQPSDHSSIQGFSRLYSAHGAFRIARTYGILQKSRFVYIPTGIERGRGKLPETPFGKFVVLFGKKFWRNTCSDSSSVVWRRLRGRLAVDYRRCCRFRYNVESGKHASLRPELVVIRVHNIVQSRLVRRIDFKCLTQDGHSVHGSDSHNHDAAARAAIFLSTDLDRPVFDHRRRSFRIPGCSLYAIPQMLRINKLRKMGWFGTVDSVESYRATLEEFVTLKMLPPIDIQPLP